MYIPSIVFLVQVVERTLASLESNDSLLVKLRMDMLLGELRVVHMLLVELRVHMLLVELRAHVLLVLRLECELMLLDVPKIIKS